MKSVVCLPISCLLCLALIAATAHASEYPNIVIFIADDHGRSEYSMLGHPDVRTPAFDAFAAQGMVLTQATAATAMCAPSRSALYTGLWPQRNGCFMNHGETRSTVRSLPHYFQALGYRTVLSGKSHVKPKSVYPFEYHGFSGKGTQSQFHWRKMRDVFVAKQPFVLIAASNEPHAPYGELRHNPKKITMPDHLPDTPKGREKWAGYLGDCERADEEFGRILRLLDETGQSESTVVIYTSDHGHSTFAKWSCYQRGLNVMTVVRWPGRIPAGSSSDALMSLIDILPTLLELAGEDPPPHIDGRSFAKILLGEGGKHRTYLFGQHTNRGTLNGSPFPIRSVRNERYHFIRNDNHENQQTNVDNYDLQLKPRHDGLLAEWLTMSDRSDVQQRIRALQLRPRYELYDLHTDAEELVNLAGQESVAPIEQELRLALHAWLEEMNDEPMRLELSVPPLLRERKKGHK